MEPIILPVGPIEANCYLVKLREPGRCAVVDPGDDAPAIEEALARQGWTPGIILLTHGHFDHIGAVKELLERYDVPLVIGEKDRELLEQPELSLGRDERYRLSPTRVVADGERVECGGSVFEVIATPGHTKGGVCYLCDGALFCGDTLFRGDCGRTDLYGGDWAVLRASLRRLMELPDETRVYPGHGPQSDIATERAQNPTVPRGDDDDLY